MKEVPNYANGTDNVIVILFVGEVLALLPNYWDVEEGLQKAFFEFKEF